MRNIFIFFTKTNLHFILSFILIMGSITSQAFSEIPTVQDKTHFARKNFENTYDEFVKKEYFGKNYNNNLVPNLSLNYDVPKNGAIIIVLIELLRKKNDDKSKFLLKKLNKFFGLEFHNFLVKTEMSKELQRQLFNAFSKLYNHKTNISSSQKDYPFRTTLSKALIFIFIVIYSKMSHTKKRENLLYSLEIIRKELISINTRQHVTNNLNEVYISEFISLLEVYTVRDPIVKPRNIKRIILFTVIALVIIGATSYILYNDGAKKITEKWKSFQKDTGKWFNDIVDSVSKIFAKNVADEVCKRIDELGQQAGAGVIHGIATGFPTNNDNPNPDLDSIINQTINRTTDCIHDKNPRLGWLTGHKATENDNLEERTDPLSHLSWSNPLSLFQ